MDLIEENEHDFEWYTANGWGIQMREPVWDDTFMECAMEEVQEMIQDAIKSRRKHFEETFTMTTMGRRVETVTITVKKERP